MEARKREKEVIAEIIRSSADKRMQHIKVKGNLADALSATSSSRWIEEDMPKERRFHLKLADGLLNLI